MKIDTLIFSQYRSGTNFFKSLVNQNSDLNIGNLNQRATEDFPSLQEWAKMKRTTHFVIDPKTLYAIDPKTLCTAKKYIYFIRKNVIRHAISKFINSLSNAPKKHKQGAEYTQLLKSLVEKADEHVAKIDQICKSIIKDHRSIKAFLLKHNLSPYTCYYEDFCACPEEMVENVLKYFDQDVPLKIKPSTTLSQSTHYHEQLEELYLKQFPFDKALHWRGK